MSLVGRSASASYVPPSYATKVNAAPISNAAEICSDPRLNLATVRAAYRAACAEEVRMAFKASSRWACAKAAHAATGASPDTFVRILDGQTETPDAILMAGVASIYTHRTKKPSRALELLVQLANGGGLQ